MLDGDNLRDGLNSNLGFSDQDRNENIRRASEVANILAESGFIVIASFITPTKQDREIAKLNNKTKFYEVYISASIKKCEERDPKGLYKKARLGEIKDFTGISAAYDEPKNPDLTIDTETLSEIELTKKLYKNLFDHYITKTDNNAKIAFPVIKEVFERPNNKFERIVVPFTDGVKTLNVITNLKEAYDSKGEQLVEDFEKNITLALIDESWKNHLRKMDELKQSVQLAVHEQKDPLLIYKFEAFELFKSMLNSLNKEVLSFLVKANLPNQQNIQEARRTTTKQNYKTSKDEVLNSDELAERNKRVGASASQQQRDPVETIVREKPKIGRNEKVKAKNIKTGEIKTMKFKKAEILVRNGEWIII